MEKVSIGKNTLGGGKKLNVALHGYSRSTHDLSHAWRSTVGVGTLVPCLKIVGLPGDTLDIDIDAKVLTHPTVGPLFGSYKLQVDIFTCPMRLYNAKLHNNALNVGLDMSKVIFPKWVLMHEKNSNIKFSQSSIAAYLGTRGIRGTSSGAKPTNAMPLCAYLDIFKNYYANKQETNAYYIAPEYKDMQIGTNNLVMVENEITGGSITATTTIYDKITEKQEFTMVFKEPNNNLVQFSDKRVRKHFDIYIDNNTTARFVVKQKIGFPATLKKITAVTNQHLKDFLLTDIDNLRELILSAPSETPFNISEVNSNYITDVINAKPNSMITKASGGLLIKTHQSDIFNNWVNKEFIEGDNGINKITAIDVSGGTLSLDTLNLAKKVYNMLNRIAVSGGTYRDWVETVYDIDFSMHAETPMYEGGYSNEIEFQEVVSNSATIIAGEEQPLGTLAGRGTTTDRVKGGKLHIKIKEPCYIMGIMSITPRVDYCQGNDWDMIELNTMDDLHKPQLDGIGWQDLLAYQMMWWKPEDMAIGKQPAWLNYMTAVNKTYGAFAEDGNENFMVLNKWFDESESGNQIQRSAEVTSYIDPAKFNYVFADNNVDSQNFWVQIGYGIKGRRVMSARQIPLM